jgi:AcrR family transcriptional regulator
VNFDKGVLFQVILKKLFGRPAGIEKEVLMDEQITASDSPVKKRGRKKRGKNREKIIRTASILMLKNGVDNTSLSDIARTAGISKGTLYYYYSSKSDLIFDITERHMNRILELIVNWVDESKKQSDPKDILMVVYRTILKAEKRGPIHLYLILEALQNNENLRERFVEIYGSWRQTVGDVLKRILPDHKDQETLAQIVLASMDGFLLQKLLGVKKIPLKKISEYLSR